MEHAFAFPLRPERDPNPPSQKMVAPMNRSGKTDAVQIGGNDNHPEKMGASRKDLADAIQSYSDNGSQK